MLEAYAPVALGATKDVSSHSFAFSDSIRLFESMKKGRRHGIDAKFLFDVLATGIERDCMLISSVHEIERHYCYRYVVKIGWSVLPLILERIKIAPSMWCFSALWEITGENPIKDGNEGVVRMMARDWLEWANWETGDDVAVDRA